MRGPKLFFSCSLTVGLLALLAIVGCETPSSHDVAGRLSIQEDTLYLDDTLRLCSANHLERAGLKVYLHSVELEVDTIRNGCIYVLLNGAAESGKLRVYSGDTQIGDEPLITVIRHRKATLVKSSTILRPEGWNGKREAWAGDTIVLHADRMPHRDEYLSLRVGALPLPLIRRGLDTAFFLITNTVTDDTIHVRMFGREYRLGTLDIHSHGKPFLAENRLQRVFISCRFPVTYAVQFDAGGDTVLTEPYAQPSVDYGKMELWRDDSLRAQFTIEVPWHEHLRMALSIDSFKHTLSGWMQMLSTGSVYDSKTKHESIFVRFKDLPWRWYDREYRAFISGPDVAKHITEFRVFIDDDIKQNQREMISFDAAHPLAHFELTFVPE